jgi:hypothetical protein
VSEELLHGELRTRLFPPLKLDVGAGDVGKLLGDVVEQQLGSLVSGGAGEDGAAAPAAKPLLFPRLSAWILQPRVIIQSPLGTLDQAPEGDPGEQWKVALPLLGLLVVGGVLWLIHALTK